jgi:hypothetical protein
MNREIEKILKEKWFLVAADFIAVIAVLLLGLNPHDGLEAFLAILGILGASLIVVVPVILEGGETKQRLAELARLRAAVKEEIDSTRADYRNGTEVLVARVNDLEKNLRQANEALAQKASAELNSVKAAQAAIEAKVAALAAAAAEAGQSIKKEEIEALSEQLEGLANTVRGLVADAEESLDDVKKARDEAKKATKGLEKTNDALEKLQSAVDGLRTTSHTHSSSAVPSEELIEETAAEDSKEEVKEVEADEAEEVEVEDEEVVEEVEGVTAPVEVATSASSGTALIINLMIGIGNKPFVRGTGPGLSQDKGVPMNFLGIGRWQWVSPEPDAPATIEVWKNDEAPLGEPLHLSGGEPVEVDESHFTGA